MAAFAYARTRATADRLLARFGDRVVQAVIRRKTPGAGPLHNPGTPTTEDFDCTAVVTRFAKNEIDGTIIRATDKKVLIAAGGLEIDPEPSSDQVVIDGQALTVVPPVVPLKPADVIVLWTLQCRA